MAEGSQNLFAANAAGKQIVLKHFPAVIHDSPAKIR
jgi:hypothetical protein